MSDPTPPFDLPASDPTVQRRARIALAVLLLLVIGGGVGGYYGWRAYQRHQDEALRAQITSVNGIGAPGRPPRAVPAVTPEDAQRYNDEMARRQERARTTALNQALDVYANTAAGERDAFVDRLIAANRTRWRQIVTTPPPTTNPSATEFLTRLKDRLAHTPATQRTNTPRPATRTARPTIRP